jgi:hypothetical protein
MYGETAPYGEAETYGEAGPQLQLEIPTPEAYAEAPYGEAYEAEMYGEAEAPLAEEMEVELASELLGIQSEAELDEFLGRLLRGARRFIASPAGQVLGSALRNAAKRLLPMAGAAIGTFVAPGVGSAIGSKLASDLARSFEGETQGPGGEVANLELARRYVRVASHAGRNLPAMPPSLPPGVAAQRALARAVRQSSGPPYHHRHRRRHRTGRWVRRGNVIVVIGA